MKKRTMILSLLMCLLISSSVFATNVAPQINLISAENVNLEVQEPTFITYNGTIKEVIENQEGVSVLVESNNDNVTDIYKNVVFSIGEQVVLLNNETRSFADFSELKEGVNLSVHYREDSPMTMSIPPMIFPLAVVVESKDANSAVKVSKFDEDFVSLDNDIKLNISEETVIMNQFGDELTISDLLDKELIVFYGPVMTMSIPAQTNANTIIAVENRVTLFNQIFTNGEMLLLENQMYKSGETVMMPLREIAEALEYKVSWNKESFLAELSKGSNWITVKPNEDFYSFSKMIVKLGKASELKNGRTYVPLDFIKEVMMLNSEVSQNGVISIYQ